jgi:hypothetical protein
MIPGEPLFLCRSLASGPLSREDYAHYLSGFDVPEHFREPEFFGPDSHDILFCLVRRIDIHLFRLVAGPAGAGPGSTVTVGHGSPVVHVDVHAVNVPYARRREARAQARARSQSVTVGGRGGGTVCGACGPPVAAPDLHRAARLGVLL